MSIMTPSRRQLLAYGAGAPLALNLAAIGQAAAQSVTASAPYRALVCVFLQGGNDSNNLLLATDKGSFAQYWTARFAGLDPIAVMPPGTAPVAIGQASPLTKRVVTATDMPEYWGGALPIIPATAQLVPAANKTTTTDEVRTFALHPMLTSAQAMFASGRLAAIANVGTLLSPLTKAEYLKPSRSTLIPQRLFSHSDQQAAWQSGHLDGSATGWGGLMADTFQATGSGLDFSAITTDGNTAFLPGVTTRPFRIGYGNNRASAQTISLVGAKGRYNQSDIFLDELRASLQENSLGFVQANDLVKEYASAVAHSIGTSAVYDTALNAPSGAYTQIPTPPAFTNPLTGKVVPNPLADQLQAVAKTAAVHSVLGVQRQVFFVQLGGFDTHDGENVRQGLLMAQIDHALAYFDSALAKVGLADQITTFTASDFNRTFTTNGDGTDHAWGGHHLVMGGAVRGGDVYGTYPTLGVDRPAMPTSAAFSNPDMAGAAFIPTTSVETYMATMAGWMGVTSAQMSNIFPRLGAFPKTDLGFMKP